MKGGRRGYSHTPGDRVKRTKDAKRGLLERHMARTGLTVGQIKQKWRDDERARGVRPDG